MSRKFFGHARAQPSSEMGTKREARVPFNVVLNNEFWSEGGSPEPTKKDMKNITARQETRPPRNCRKEKFNKAPFRTTLNNFGATVFGTEVGSDVSGWHRWLGKESVNN